jgi:putative intracellular protease/amidase
MKNIAVLLFTDFETLDVFGPVEIFGRNTELFKVQFYSENGGLISNSHGVTILTEKLENIRTGVDVFLIPGGYGTRQEVNNEILINEIKQISENSKYVLTACTGTALLAKTGLINGKNATTNKRAIEWVISQNQAVNWVRKARWVVDGKYYTSSGVSAGMDMTLGFISDINGVDFARSLAYQIEFNWQENSEIDNFYIQEY